MMASSGMPTRRTMPITTPPAAVTPNMPTSRITGSARSADAGTTPAFIAPTQMSANVLRAISISMATAMSTRRGNIRRRRT